MQTLSVIDDNIWSVTHHFKVNGAMASSRMTVIRLQDNQMVLAHVQVVQVVDLYFY